MQDESHDYPLRGNKHLNPIGINLEPVQMFMRTKHDFDHPDRLKDVDAPQQKSLTNYEAYLTKEQRTRTKGFFMNDPQRLAVIKHAAGY